MVCAVWRVGVNGVLCGGGSEWCVMGGGRYTRVHTYSTPLC